MKTSEAFLIQWGTLQEEMVQAVHSRDSQGGILFEDLDRIFQSKIKRWSTQMTVEGRWMVSQKNEQAKSEVLRALSALHLTKIEGISAVGANIPVTILATAAGVSAGAAAGYLISSKIVLGIVGAVIGGGLTFTGVNAGNGQKHKTVWEKQMQGYLDQVEQAGQSIAAIWRQYDGEVD